MQAKNLSSHRAWLWLHRLTDRCLRFTSVLWARFQEDLLNVRAMALTYTTLVSLVPFLAVTFSVLKAFGIQDQLEPLLVQGLQPLGAEGDEIRRRLIEFVDHLPVGVLGAVGAVGLFYTTISLIGRIEEALDCIWRVRRARTWGEQFRDYLGVLLVGPLVVSAAFALIASAQSHALVADIIAIEPLGFFVVLLTRVTPFILLWAIFTFIYKFLPNTYVRLTSALVGGGVGAALWLLGGTAFAALVAGSASYPAIYSSFAILILFFIWLYIAWLIVLVGAEVAHLHQYPTISREVVFEAPGYRLREWQGLQLLVEIARRYFAGQPTSPPVELATHLRIPLSTVEELVDAFVQHGLLLRATEPEGIALTRSPEEVSALEIFDILRGPQSPADLAPSESAVSQLIDRRERAIQEVMEGATLKSLAA
ncbi:MAG: YhjD/YihY/BrkB family envelope integrity protein [Gammaproteobacteria bacterium]